MTNRAGFCLITLLYVFLHVEIAGAQELQAHANAIAASSVAAESGPWPWIAFTGLLVTLGAVALSRRRMPFGTRD